MRPMPGKPVHQFAISRAATKDGFVRMSPYSAAGTREASKKADAIKAQMIAGTLDIFKARSKTTRVKS